MCLLQEVFEDRIILQSEYPDRLLGMETPFPLRRLLRKNINDVEGGLALEDLIQSMKTITWSFARVDDKDVGVRPDTIRVFICLVMHDCGPEDDNVVEDFVVGVLKGVRNKDSPFFHKLLPSEDWSVAYY